MSDRARFKKSPFVFVLFGFLLLLIVLAGSPEIGSAVQDPVHKVVASKNLISEDDQDIVLWHDYDSFALYRVTHEAWLRLPAEVRSQVQLVDDMDYLLVGAASSRISREALPQGEESAFNYGESLHLVQFVGPIKDEWLRAVEATGTELVHYVANYGYLVWTDESGRKKLNELAENGRFLQLSTPYLPAFKLGPTLGVEQTSLGSSDDLVPVTVQLYRHDGIGKSEAVLRSVLVDIAGPWEFVLNYQNINAVINRKDIAIVAALPDVVWVGENFRRELNDEVQGQIMANNLTLNQNAPSGPGYFSWFSSLGLSSNPLSYPIVDITDDGIGNGIALAAAGDITLRELGDAANPSRLAYIANCTSASNGSGTDGHGHINVSIAGGYDSRSGFPYRDTNEYQLGLGINPYGRFAGTRVFDDSFDISGCGGTDRSLVRETYNRGARIVSNSWGCSECAGVYDASSQAYDASVRDADSLAGGNQELSILFSAGNSGPASDSIGSPGNGKNVITVGASENVRPTWTDGCGMGPNEANYVQDIAIFSSRGPAPGERVKPDVAAPGTHIQGTASTTPTYTGLGVCDKYYPSAQTIFAASSGTSHSTPAVAGYASLIYSFLQQKYGISYPSPAMLKSYIVAHTMYLNGSGAGGDWPSFDQGYGLPDMNAALVDTPRVILDQSQLPRFTASGETWSLTAAAAEPSKPVRVVMAYTDQPGAVGTQPQVNNLNLSVQADGATYHGNHLSGQWSTPGGVADNANNVEAVFLPSLDDSTVRIDVTAFNIAGDGVPGVGDYTDQDFTIVCSNCIEQEDFTLSAQPVSNSLCKSGDAEYNLFLESVLGFSESVALNADGVPAGISHLFSQNPVTPTDSSLLTLTAAESSLPGSYAITVTGDSSSRHHSVEIGLELYSETPSVPELLAPPNGSSDLPVEVVFSWTAGSQAASYEIQIALDSGFTQIYEDEAGITETSYSATNLLSGQVYFWRVRAENSCGTGDYSAANMFSTERLPGGCPPGILPKIIYSSDFEDSAPGWSHQGSGDTWQLSENRSHSATTAFHARDVDQISDQRLISPAISLPPDPAFLTLQYWNYRAIEGDALQSGTCFDAGILEISTDDGTSWQQIGNTHNNSALLTDPYSGVVDLTYGNPLSGKYGWCGDPQEWISSIVRLDNYGGQSVRFRFRLGSDSSRGKEGWYIDDVRVQGCQIEYKESFLSLIVTP